MLPHPVSVTVSASTAHMQVSNPGGMMKLCTKAIFNGFFVESARPDLRCECAMLILAVY